MANKKIEGGNKFGVLTELIIAIRNLLYYIANPSYVDKSVNASRVQIVSGTVTTVTTVTTLSNIDSYQGKILVISENVNCWANTVRRTIS